MLQAWTQHKEKVKKVKNTTSSYKNIKEDGE